MNRTVIIVAVALSGLVLAYILWGLLASRVEHPKYTVIQKDGNIEVREYAPQLVAQVQVAGERDEAINQGFRLLADFIFGNNSASESISMTAPVQQSSTQISMTAPVQQQQAGDKWLVEFIMPSQYDMETLPKPNNPAVKIIERAKTVTIAIQFSGLMSQSNLDTHLEKLNTYIESNSVTLLNGPIYAFYNPPWTAPFLRRNEIYYVVQQ